MADKLQTILFMVRHGETDRNYSLVGADDAKRELTELGRKQSQAVGQYLADFQPSAIYSSPLDRCKDTAEIIRQEIGLSDEITFTNQLLEIYAKEPRDEAGERGESVFKTILGSHKGEQVVAVTHQYIIGYAVADFLGVEYRDVPCGLADIYRLVFADETLIEAIRLQPANGI